VRAFDSLAGKGGIRKQARVLEDVSVLNQVKKLMTEPELPIPPPRKPPSPDPVPMPPDPVPDPPLPDRSPPNPLPSLVN